MSVTAKSILSSKRYLDLSVIPPPSWQEIADELRRTYGKSELTKGEIAKYLGCEASGDRMKRLLDKVPYVGRNTGKRYHVQSVAKAYIREFH